MMNKKGFTLIELLVVVLIIGILTAVALPQYQLAVAKARVAKLMPLLKSLHDAQEAYYLANGQHALSFDELDIDIPPNPISITKSYSANGYVYGDYAYYKDFRINLLSHSGKIVYVILHKPTHIEFGMYLTGTKDSACKDTGKMAITTKDTLSYKIIHAMGGKQYIQTEGYNYYCLP